MLTNILTAAAISIMCGTFAVNCFASPTPISWLPDPSQPALNFTTPGSQAISSSAASNPAGTLAAVWQEDPGTGVEQIMYATRKPGGSFTKAQRLSDPASESYQPKVAISDRGDIIASWITISAGDTDIVAAIAPAGHPFSKPIVVGTEDRSATVDSELAMNGSGQIAITWSTAGGKKASTEIKASTGNITGSFKKPEVLSTESATLAKTAIGEDGRVITTWDVPAKVVGKKTSYSEIAIHPPGASSFSSAQPISEPGNDTSVDSLIVDANGDAFLTVTTIDPAALSGGSAIQIAKSPKGSARFNPIQKIITSNAKRDPYGSILVSNQAGDRAITWVEFESATSRTIIQAADVNSDGTPQKSTVVTDSSTRISNVKAALNSKGTLTLAWLKSDGFSSNDVQVSAQEKGVGFTRPVTISDNPSDLYITDLVNKSPGNGLVLWQEFDGTDSFTKGRMF